MNQQLYAVEQQAKWHMPEEFQSHILHLGAFHTYGCLLILIFTQHALLTKCFWANNLFGFDVEQLSAISVFLHSSISGVKKTPNCKPRMELLGTGTQDTVQCRVDLFSVGGGGIPLGLLEVNAQSQRFPSLVNRKKYLNVWHNTHFKMAIKLRFFNRFRIWVPLHLKSSSHFPQFRTQRCTNCFSFDIVLDYPRYLVILCCVILSYVVINKYNHISY